MAKKIDILGLEVLAATRAEAVAAMDRAVAAPEPALICYLNAHISNIAWRNPALTAALERSLLMNDGVGVDLAAKWIHGEPFPENLNGTDMTPRFLAETEHRLKVFLLGARPTVAELAQIALRKIAPRHDYVGARGGYFPDERSDEVAAEIRASGADVVIVCMGAPRQEIWTAAHLEAMGCKAAICAGALFDFLSHGKRRAPPFVRKYRFEWLWRLMLEPRRLFRRYVLGNPLFVMRVIRARLVRGRG